MLIWIYIANKYSSISPKKSIRTGPKYEYDDGGSYMFVKKSKGLIFYHIRNCVIIKFVPENTPTHESRHPLTIITSMSTLTVRQPHTWKWNACYSLTPSSFISIKFIVLKIHCGALCDIPIPKVKMKYRFTCLTIMPSPLFPYLASLYLLLWLSSQNDLWICALCISGSFGVLVRLKVMIELIPWYSHWETAIDHLNPKY